MANITVARDAGAKIIGGCCGIARHVEAMILRSKNPRDFDEVAMVAALGRPGRMLTLMKWWG